jgi:hypothetical protein
MYRIKSIELNLWAVAQRADLGHVIAAAVKVALGGLIVGSVVFGVAVRAGVAPEFDQRIALDTRHILVIHNGPSPTCASIPNPPQHDCFWPGPERREFTVDYLTPHGVRSLVWFWLPPH